MQAKVVDQFDDAESRFNSRATWQGVCVRICVRSRTGGMLSHVVGVSDAYIDLLLYARSTNRIRDLRN